MAVREWINTLNTVSFASLTNQALWMMGSLVFTATAAWLLTRPDQFNEAGVLIASGAGMRTVGFELAAALLFAWTGKSAISAASRFGKSVTAVPYVEAKERAKAMAPAPPPGVTVDAKDQAIVRVESQNGHADQLEREPPAEGDHRWRDPNRPEGLG
jgi:hypothetical protein